MSYTNFLGHDQVRYLEVIDAMLCQLMARLWAAEANGEGTFAICVTADHSTPVLFGDHSLEPVPFAIARLRCGFAPCSRLTAKSEC